MPVITLLKLLVEIGVLGHLRDRQNTPLKRTAALLAGPLREALIGRVVVGVLGGVLLPGVWLLTEQESGTEFLVIAVFVLSLVGETLERWLFFSAVVAPKMPGGIA
jgi:hypothetical protein